MKDLDRSGWTLDPEESRVLGFYAPQRARELLSRHPHFYGRADLFEFEWLDEMLIVKGTVPTYYLKQLLQSALKQLDNVRIDDRVEVVRPERGRDKSWQ